MFSQNPKLHLYQFRHFCTSKKIAAINTIEYNCFTALEKTNEFIAAQTGDRREADSALHDMSAEACSARWIRAGVKKSKNRCD